MGNIRQHMKAEKWDFRRHQNCKMTIPEEVVAVRRYKNGDKMSTIASDNNVCKATIWSIITKEYGENAYQKTKWTDEEIRFLKKNARKKTLKEISNILDRGSTSAVCQKARNLGITCQKGPRDRGGRKHDVNHNFFDQINTPRKAYWLGVLWADGCNENNSIISLGVKKGDRQWLEKFKSDIGASYPIYEYNNMASIAIASVSLAESLSNLGIVPRKTYKGLVPDITNDMYNHFIRGLFDGDGYISKDRPSLEITNTKETCNWLYTSLQKMLNIKGHVGQRSGSDVAYRWQLWGKNRVEKFGKWLYGDSSRKLDRKYNRFKQLGLVSGGA